MKKLCIICDIDGVFADSRAWEKYAPESKDRGSLQEWREFAKHVSVCKPNPEVIEALTGLDKLVKIIFITSRSGSAELKANTLHQLQYFSKNKLKKFGNNSFLLYMRKEGDMRSSSVIKEEVLKSKIFPHYIPILAIDDEEENINMYKKYNIPTLHYTKFRK